ncbi:hypothetical protein ACFPU0_11745 [Pseudomonas sp. GCM10022186]|uniref:hypothetical protein n=1 Tax=Pseudomonas sp. GCM10022186 TaxID=3252650 RepID=UPI00361C7EA9
MPKKNRTAYFTKRGLAKGNIWKAYSAKTDKIVVLSSDRELAHWLINLEFNPSVIDFNLGSIVKEIRVDNSIEKIVLSAESFYKEGRPEWQLVRTASGSDTTKETVRLDRAKQLALTQGCSYREYTDIDLFPQKSKILPLLRVANLLSFGRKFQIPDSLRLVAEKYFSEHRSGTLRSYISATLSYEQSLSLYLFFSEFSKGKIALEFSESPFYKETGWALT